MKVRLPALLDRTIGKSSNGLIVFDMCGDVVTVNQAHVRLYGFASIDAAMQDHRDENFEVRSPNGALIDPSEWPIQRVLRGESIIDLEIFALPKGQITPHHVRINGEPIFDNQGNQILAIIISHDLREEERPLHHDEIKLRMFDSLTEGVMLLDTNGNVRSANAAVERLFDQTVAELTYATLDSRHQLLRDDGTPFPEAEQPMIITLRTGEQVQNVTMGLQSRNGDIRWCSVSTHPLFTPHGVLEGVVATFFDVTDGKRREDAQRDTERNKDKFLAAFCHELKNFAASLSSGFCILRTNPLTSPVAPKVLGLMEHQFNDVLSLIDDILDVIRIGTGKLRLKKIFIEARSIVEDAIESSQSLLSERKHRLSIHFADDALPLYVDCIRIKQVICNLLTNAAKYTPEGGSIEITTLRDGEYFVLRITDSGQGIPPEMLEEIFGLFTQIEGALPYAKGGLGIGLALARRLVQAHQGTITAESRGVGAGSTFSVRLPLERRPHFPLTPNESPAHFNAAL